MKLGLQQCCSSVPRTVHAFDRPLAATAVWFLPESLRTHQVLTKAEVRHCFEAAQLLGSLESIYTVNMSKWLSPCLRI